MKAIPLHGPRNLRYDGALTIAVGRSRKETNWKPETLLWSALLQRLATPRITGESLAEYRAMSKAQRDDVKDVGGFVGGPIRGGRRRAGAVEGRQLITLDVDYADPSLWDQIQLLFPYAIAVYSTHSHTPEQPRLRLLAPASRVITPEEYPAVARMVAADLGIDQFDPTTFEVHRLMYWPSCSRDAEYVFEYLDGPWLDVDAILGRYRDWRDVPQWPRPQRELAEHHKAVQRAEDPHAKPGIVGAFCRTYTVEEAIEAFLGDVYGPAGEGRYTYLPGSTVGGAIVYDDGKFLYSHHATDPAAGRACNAFDLVRIHRFGHLDEEAPEGTPVTQLPSYAAMMELAAGDKQVKATLGREQLEAAGADFGSGNTDWLEQLRRHPKTGQILSEAGNIKLILQNDPNLTGKFALDDFAHRAVICAPVPWRDLERGHYWGDHDDAGLRNYLAEVYGVKGPSVINDAFLEVQAQNAYHPVRDYLNSLAWDGVPRVEALLIDYLGADDTRYTRAVTRKMLAAAVARVFVPGCKFDHVLVLVGPQGIGKSLLLHKLGRQWYSDSLNTMQGKDAYELLQGVWIMELGELAATRRAEVEVVKHFISKQADMFRVAYGRHTTVFPRQCVFFGTTNEAVFLKDRTGNRRFWPVPVRRGPHPKSLWTDFTDAEVDQVWAEALAIWRAGEALYLDQELEAEAVKLQEMHAEESEKFGLVQEYLELLLPENWANMDIPARREYIHGSDFGEVPRGTMRRDRVCAMEIWVELFNGDPKALTPMQAREINDILRQMPGWRPYTGGTQSRLYFGKHYGRQRAFVRENV